jgi:FKBP-type peptidyl-prolyl cis-trans isomerase
MRRPLSALSLLFALSVGLSGCGSDSVTSPTIETATFAPALGVNLAASTKVSDMYYRDILVGTGAVVQPGQTVSVHYTGWLANGTQFDANGPSDPPLPFVLGTGNVIVGWHVGVAGMRVGGQRQLIIPPSLGYGSRGNGPIPGNSILVFMVTVVSAR